MYADAADMNQPVSVEVTFRLDAPQVAVAADVVLRSIGGRWTAAAVLDGQRRLGLGRNAREAFEAALASLAPSAARAILADLQLLGPSIEILRLEGSIAS